MGIHPLRGGDWIVVTKLNLPDTILIGIEPIENGHRILCVDLENKIKPVSVQGNVSGGDASAKLQKSAIAKGDFILIDDVVAVPRIEYKGILIIVIAGIASYRVIFANDDSIAGKYIIPFTAGDNVRTVQAINYIIVRTANQ